MKKIKVVPIPGTFINHEHLCLLNALVEKRSFIRLCPMHIKSKSKVFHDDYCDTCKYSTRMDFYDDYIQLFIDGQQVIHEDK